MSIPTPATSPVGHPCMDNELREGSQTGHKPKKGVQFWIFFAARGHLGRHIPIVGMKTAGFSSRPPFLERGWDEIPGKIVPKSGLQGYFGMKTAGFSSQLPCKKRGWDEKGPDFVPTTQPDSRVDFRTVNRNQESTMTPGRGGHSPKKPRPGAKKHPARLEARTNGLIRDYVRA